MTHTHTETHTHAHYTASLLVPSFKVDANGNPTSELMSAREAIDHAKKIADLNGMNVVHMDSIDQILPNQQHDGAWRVSLHVHDKDDNGQH